MSLQTATKFKRSPFFYVGDKYKLLPQLEEHFPKNIDRFIEPFCGGGSVFLNTEANQYLINDINKYMISLHKFLISNSHNQDEFWNNLCKYISEYGLSATFLNKNVPDELRLKFKKTYFAKYNKEAYIKLRNDFNADKKDMMKLYMLLIYGFNRMLRFNYDFLTCVNPTPDDFVYLDPPYLITFSEYNKLWNEENELRLIQLLDELNNKGVRFAVSNVLWHKKRYNAIFNFWAQKYNIVNIQSNYISFHDNTEKGSIEVLVKNY